VHTGEVVSFLDNPIYRKKVYKRFCLLKKLKLTSRKRLQFLSWRFFAPGESCLASFCLVDLFVVRIKLVSQKSF